jgi:hypothetical protein
VQPSWPSQRTATARFRTRLKILEDRNDFFRIDPQDLIAQEVLHRPFVVEKTAPAEDAVAEIVTVQMAINDR